MDRAAPTLLFTRKPLETIRWGSEWRAGRRGVKEGLILSHPTSNFGTVDSAGQGYEGRGLKVPALTAQGLLNLELGVGKLAG